MEISPFCQYWHKANATCCPLQTMPQGFRLGRCICQKRYIVCIVFFWHSIVCFLPFFRVKRFFSLDLSRFKVCSLGRLWTDVGLAEHLQQCQRILCLHPWNKLLFSCFYRSSLSLPQFLLEDYRLEVFAPSSLCVWNKMPRRNPQIRVLPRSFLHELLRFDEMLESMMLWIGFSENDLILLKNFVNVWFDAVD